MSQKDILKLINKQFGNRNLEGYCVKQFQPVEAKKPLRFNFSFVSFCEHSNNGVFIRLINADDIYSFKSVELLSDWEESLDYGNKYFCIIVTIKDNHIVPNIMYSNKFYYSRNDIKKLYDDFSKITYNKLKK